MANKTDECLCISLQTTTRCAVNVLLQAIAPEIAIIIEEEQTANHIWKYLEQCYSKGTIIQPYVLLTKLIHLVQVGSVNEFFSNIEHIANERALMGHPIDTRMKLGCLLHSIQPHLRPYTTAYEAWWELLALSKTTKSARSSNADYELQLVQLFEATTMGLHNYEESVHLKEDETDSMTHIARFTNLGSLQQCSSTLSQGKPNAAVANQVICWKCSHHGHISTECPDPEKEEKQGKRGKRGKGKQKSDSAKSARENRNNQSDQNAHVLTVLTTGTANKKVIEGWIWDTGADVHICKDESLMTDI
ncbi:hypothetical protein NDA14_005537 [Ustilago hordei]|nr:hypothetical protein NDA14_005537 [Ustilago hordei]UTT92571.1 hypothetical protein NDA17_007239 [Ustilago hordei]